MKSSIRDDALFIDTWGWLALADAKDPAHSRAVAERRMRATGRLVTTDYVLDETFTRLFARCGFSVARQFSSAVLEAASKRQLVLERITPPRFDAAYQMRLRYRDKPEISFTDVTSFVIMREIGIKDGLTVDANPSDFAGFRIEIAPIRRGYSKMSDGVSSTPSSGI
jgi:predicted nucleic acid-binding protein